MSDKNLYIIAGCNGAGKTTASFTILPEIINCKEYVNADEIARGISPFQPEKVAFEAGRIMLKRINELLNQGKSFAFETTLSTISYKNYIERAKNQGYRTTLLFFWLDSVDLAKERVKTRVEEGGHYIEESIIERRYKTGLKNLFKIYISILDGTLIFDNTEGKHELIAYYTQTKEVTILNETKFQQLKISI